MSSGVPASLSSSPAGESPGGPEGTGRGGLRERLRDVASDRASSAAQIVLEASGIVRGWLAGRAEAEIVGPGFESALEDFSADQGWRGPCALWIDSQRRTLAFAADGDRSARDVLEEELGHWLLDDDRGNDGELTERATRSDRTERQDPWDGEPLTEGRRLPSRVDLARGAADEIDPGDTVLVTAFSETVALALETAWRAGKRPNVLLGEGMPDLDGRRMARRLVRSGVATTLVYDHAVPGLVPSVDRLWLSSEAIGAGAFLARLGTQALIEECVRRDVPVRVLATSDKLVPGGAIRLPAWAAREGWRLWEDAPAGVRLEPQFHQAVPTELLELAGGFLTEIGPESVASMHLRALRVEAAPPGGGIAREMTLTQTPNDP
jgi:hypothetical protein